MKRLDADKMILCNGLGGWGCAGALFLSASAILALAGATVATGGAAGVVLAGAFLGNVSATMAVYDQCM